MKAIAQILILALFPFVLIKTYPWHCVVVLSLISGGFLIGFSLSMYAKSEWAYGGGILCIIIGLFFLPVMIKDSQFKEK